MGKGSGGGGRAGRGRGASTKTKKAKPTSGKINAPKLTATGRKKEQGEEEA